MVVIPVVVIQVAAKAVAQADRVSLEEDFQAQASLELDSAHHQADKHIHSSNVCLICLFLRCLPAHSLLFPVLFLCFAARVPVRSQHAHHAAPTLQGPEYLFGDDGYERPSRNWADMFILQIGYGYLAGEALYRPMRVPRQYTS